MKVGDSVTKITDNPGVWSTDFIITAPLQPLSVTSTLAQKQNVSCNGGSDGAIQITVAGGTGGYTYLWNDNYTGKDRIGLSKGMYSVTVTDSNGCPKTVSEIIITEPSAITIPTTIPTTNVTVFGQNTGALILPAGTPTGGNGGYTYKWTSTTDINFGTKYTRDISGLYAGFYTLEVRDAKANVADNKGCIAIQNFEVTQNPEMKVVLSETQFIKCNGDFNGEIEAVVTGGVAPYSYSWFKNGSSISGITNTQSGIGLGDYTVTVADLFGATKTATVYTLTQPEKLSVNLTNQTNVKCNGAFTGAIKITITGGTTTYKSIIWTKAGDTSFVANDPLNPTNLGFGEYQVVVTDAHDCTATLLQSVKITQPDFLLEIKNPIITNLTGFETKNGKIAITVAGGTPAYVYAWYTGFKKDWTNTNASIPNNVTATIANLTAGDYYVRVTDQNLICVVDQDFNVKQPKELIITTPIRTGNAPILCYGSKTAEFTTTITGGVPLNITTPYTIVWLNTTTGIKYANTQTTTNEITTSTASNLGAGDYVITVIDKNSNKLNGTNTFTIAQPQPLAFTYTTTDVTCKGASDGTIQLNITGGTANYNIICASGIVNNGTKTITGLGYGSYIVFIQDNNNCKTPEQTIKIAEPTVALAFDANIIPKPTTGFGKSDGSIALNIFGGWGTYSYKWYTGIGTNSTNLILNETNAILSNKSAGRYTAEVTDTNKDGLGCPVVKSFEIKEPTIPTLALAKTEAKCNGLLGSIQATATGGFPYSDLPITRTYTYNLYRSTDLSTAIDSQNGSTANFTGLQTGNYTVIATDTENNSTTNETIAIFQPTPIVVTLNSKSPVLCFGENQGAISLNATGGTPFTTNAGATFYNYVWKKDGVPVGTNNASQTSLFAGTYAVEVQDANYNPTNPASCVGILNNIVIIDPVDLKFNYDKLKNSKPTSTIATDGSIHIEMIGGQQSYTYRCTRGTENGPEVFLKTTTDLAVDIINLSRDHYFITVTDNTGCPRKIDYDFNSTTNLTVSLQTPIDILCKNYTTTLNSIVAGGIGGNQYTWFKNGAKIDGATNPTLTNAGIGNYYVVVINADKKEETSNEITVTEPLQVEFSTTQQSVKCKGESNGAIMLTAMGGNGKFQYRYFYQNTGTGIFIPFTNTSTTSITGLLAGEYTIEVQDANTCTAVYKKETVTQPAEVVTIASTTKTPTLRFGSNEGTITVTPQGGNGGYTYEWFRKDNSKINQTTATATKLFAGEYYVIIKDAKGCSVTSSLIEVIQPPLLLAGVAIQNLILCQGSATASVKASATGGFLNPGENYTYKWFAYGTTQLVLGTNAILGNLKAGDSYFVVATDSNKINALSGQITITEPTAVNNFLTADYTLCGDAKDWTIATNPNQGTPPYTYIWNTSETTPSIKVAAGTYNVTVSDKNGCSINNEIVLVIPAHLDAKEVITKPTCFEGNDATIVVTTTNGTAPFTYLWSTGETSNILSNASAKAYSVHIKDARGCFITRNYTIENPPKDVINIGDDVTLCKGQSLTINATIKDNKATYAWTADNGFVSDKAIVTISKQGTYSLTVTNNLGCKATDTIKISNDNIDISAEFAVSSQVFVNEKFVIVDISNPQPDSLEWVLPVGANVTTKNKDFAEMSFSKAGEYELTINTQKGNCTAFQTKKILVVEGNYVDPELDAKTVFDLKIYPNPSDGNFTIDVKLESAMPVKIKLYNLTNNAIIDSKSDQGKSEYTFGFDLNGLASGVYYVLFESKQGNKLRKIIVK